MSNGEITERELDVWQLMAKGLRNESISKELCIDIKTVERHITNIMNKTKIYRDNVYNARVWLVLNYERSRYFGRVQHGELLDCPSCGAPGKYDEMQLGEDRNEAEYKDAIWFSKHGNGWECSECWLK